MAKIIYVLANGVERSVDIPVGQSLMEGAVKHGLPGIDADCGGACVCATCHIVVRDDWRDCVGPPLDLEGEVLEFADGAGPGSRLGCQVKVVEAFDGLVVRIPG